MAELAGQCMVAWLPDSIGDARGISQSIRDTRMEININKYAILGIGCLRESIRGCLCHAPV